MIGPRPWKNKTAFTADGQGKATVPFAVKDGLTVSIKALDYNAVYTVSEDDYSSLGVPRRAYGCERHAQRSACDRCR